MVSTGQGEMIQDIVTEFERIWRNAEECTKEYDEFIEEYRKRFEEKKLFEKMVSEQKEIAKRESVPSIEAVSQTKFYAAGVYL